MWTTAESWQLKPQYLMLYEGFNKKQTNVIILKHKSPLKRGKEKNSALNYIMY